MKQSRQSATTKQNEPPITGDKPSGSPPADKPATSEYFRVRFHEAQSEHESPNVEIGVNGRVLQFPRGVESIAPKSFLEIADHSTHRKFKTEKGQSLKVVGRVRRFPYDLLGQATEAEFLAFLTAGNKIRDRDIKSQEMAEQARGG